MKSKFYYLKSKVIKLRKSGKTYGEILKIVKVKIPKSTLSDWCHNIYLTSSQKKRIDIAVKENCRKGMEVARIVNKERRKKYFESIVERNKKLSKLIKNKGVAKIALAMLYLGEGGKTHKGSLSFGNSSPFVVSMFLNLLRFCYSIKESKFRCTIQCRADQNIKELERFWVKLTMVPKGQFYKSRIDPRTIGKPSRKMDYKGVCRIDYFSADIFWDLMQIPKIINNGPVA